MIKSVYPNPAGEEADDDATRRRQPAGRAPRRIVRSCGPTPKSCLPSILEALMREARRDAWPHGIRAPRRRFRRQRRALFVLYDGATSIDDRMLRASVAFGPERTMEQDPLFCVPHHGGHRAEGAVSCHQRPDDGRARARPDPPPAAVGGQAATPWRVLSLTRLGRRVSSIERRTGKTSSTSPAPRSGCGAGNVQVARRLRSMLENLVTSLQPLSSPSAHRGAPTAGSRVRASLRPTGRSCTRTHRGFTGARSIIRQAVAKIRSRTSLRSGIRP